MKRHMAVEDIIFFFSAAVEAEIFSQYLKDGEI